MIYKNLFPLIDLMSKTLKFIDLRMRDIFTQDLRYVVRDCC